MPELRDLCDEILDQMARIGYPIYLHPGISLAELRGFEADLPFAFPAALVDMYQWRNGTSIVNTGGPGSCFFPWWCFDAVAESVERYRILAGPMPIEVGATFWRADWFPIFSGSDISSIGIRCKPVEAEDGEIICYDHTAETRVAYVSLRAMLQTICAAYKAGVIFLGTTGELDFDQAGYFQIAKSFNPGEQPMP
jgi:hypothetical protein